MDKEQFETKLTQWTKEQNKVNSFASPELIQYINDEYKDDRRKKKKELQPIIARAILSTEELETYFGERPFTYKRKLTPEEKEKRVNFDKMKKKLTNKVDYDYKILLKVVQLKTNEKRKTEVLDEIKNDDAANVVNLVNADDADVADNIECSACKFPFYPCEAFVACPQCPHLIHSACLMRWPQRTCPNCRFQIAPPQVTQVDLTDELTPAEIYQNQRIFFNREIENIIEMFSGKVICDLTHLDFVASFFSTRAEIFPVVYNNPDALYTADLSIVTDIAHFNTAVDFDHCCICLHDDGIDTRLTPN